MICLFSFPRSGSTWLMKCLNTLPGVSLYFEPFFHPGTNPFQAPNPPALAHWLEPPLCLYRSQPTCPRPPQELIDAIPTGVKGWMDQQSAWNGFKEVYSGHYVAPLIAGAKLVDDHPAVIYLWRRFNGVAASFAKRRFRWLIDGFESRGSLAEGTGVEPLWRCVPGANDLERLFVTWLTALYADRKDIEALGGHVVSHRSLASAQPHSPAWAALYELLHVGATVNPRVWHTVNVGNGPRTGNAVARDVAAFTARHRAQLSALKAGAMAAASNVEHPGIIHAILDGWP